MDTYGRPLTKNGSDEADTASGLSLERQRRIEQDLTTRVVSLLEPIIIVVMGVFVGLLVLSILLPILNLTSGIG